MNVFLRSRNLRHYVIYSIISSAIHHHNRDNYCHQLGQSYTYIVPIKGKAIPATGCGGP
jgi:hypothetical protein